MAYGVFFDYVDRFFCAGPLAYLLIVCAVFFGMNRIILADHFFLAIVFCRCTWGMTIYFCILVIILLCGLKLYSDGSDFRAGVFFSPESFNNATFPSH